MYFTVFLGLCQAIDFPFFRKIVEEKKEAGEQSASPLYIAAQIGYNTGAK
jgi:hypothetical protein